MRLISMCLAAAVAVLSVPTAAFAQIELVPVVSGLSSPVFVGHADDNLNRLFIVEQAGVIKVLQPSATEPTTFLDIRTRILAGGERGLLGLAFHPQYASNGRFFVFYTRAGDGALVIAEYAASPPSSDSARTTEEILMTIPHPGFSNHNGGMLGFGPEGLLYAGVGDGGGANDPNNNAQNVGTLLGKILRIDVNSGATYTSPADNPFVGIAGLNEISPTACATHGASALIAAPVSCRSATSVRALVSSARRFRAVAIMDGPSSRGTCAPRRDRTRTNAPIGRITAFPSLITNTSAAAAR